MDIHVYLDQSTPMVLLLDHGMPATRISMCLKRNLDLSRPNRKFQLKVGKSVRNHFWVFGIIKQILMSSVILQSH